MPTTEGRRTRWNYADVEGPPERITPLYDNLLVRRLDDDEYKGLLVLPNLQKTLDGRWVRKSDEGPRRGVVVAAGRGDKISHDCLKQHPFVCHFSDLQYPDERKDMAVQVGDVIIYPRFESSHVKIDGVQHTFVHEADVMAVIEPDPRLLTPADLSDETLELLRGSLVYAGAEFEKESK